MFTLDQISTAHAKVKSGADFPQYVQDLKALGVTHYDTFVADGHSDFYGAGGTRISSPARYDAMPVASEADPVQFKHSLLIHQQGQTDYPAFCDQSAAAGVEKWTTNIDTMEVVYYDTKENVLLTEAIRQL